MAGKNTAGIVGFFSDERALLQAAAKVKDAQYLSFDAFSPYPVHGLDQAMGLRRSWLPYVTFGGGLTGVTLGYLLQWWTSSQSWPVNVGGKPFNSVPAWVPVIFELTILFAGVSTVVALILGCRLPNVKKRAFDPAITRDRFAVMIEAPCGGAAPAGGKKFDESEITSFLKSIGAQDVRVVAEEGWF
ncbi:MAG: DUF3341 domain-containing protein [Bdellovibrionales bacterium]|nr:DUF3341 domain-containing protein [Bdellovibrionales bacterium]